jgi:hypothetical protein
MWNGGYTFRLEGRKNRSSFLKKRSKKLLSVSGRTGIPLVRSGLQVIDKSSLLPFFNKEHPFAARCFRVSQWRDRAVRRAISARKLGWVRDGDEGPGALAAGYTR